MYATGLEVEAARAVAGLCRVAELEAVRVLKEGQLVIHALRIKSWGLRAIHGMFRIALRFR